jgi:hypothetical protein
MNKRDQSRLERELARSLTDACEMAKSELVGFAWLTHEVDYDRFPHSLQVTWIFETEAHKADASTDRNRKRIASLTCDALSQVGIDIAAVKAPIHLDSEEACLKADAGEWPHRLARRMATRH